MSDEEIEAFENDAEMALYREYRDVLPMFSYVVETERRFYLANRVDVQREADGWLRVELVDAWVWDIYRPARFVQRVEVRTTRDVNIEELSKKDDMMSGENPLT